MSTLIQFKGKDYWAADILVSSGARPSETILYGPNDIVENTTPGSLYISTEDQQFTINGMRLVSPQNRPVRWDDQAESQFLLVDRRQAWWEVMHSCRYNILKADGGRFEERNCKQMFEDLLAVAGEALFFTSFASTELYPTIDNLSDVSVGSILEELCEISKHTIGFLPNGTVAVYALGHGGNQLVSSDTLKSVPQASETLPLSRTAISAPTVFESVVDLEARAMESDGELVALADASYKPPAGWGGQWPGQYGDVSSGSQYLACRSLYRIYVVTGITNDEQTADIVVNADDFTIISKGTGVYDNSRSAELIPQVTGEFWPEVHKGDISSSAGEHWFGGFEVVDNVFHFDRPVFKVSSKAISPAVLKATVRHTCRDATGGFVCERVGDGPEAIASWVTPVIRNSIGTNVSQVEAELTEFKRICDREAATGVGMQIHAGIIPAEVNGICRTVRYKVGESKVASGFAETEFYYGKNWEGLLV
jgi:hypothetical protein